MTAPGPYRASQLREGDRYELSQGHVLECAPAGNRHAQAHGDGAMVLRSDPAAAGRFGIDLGIAAEDDQSLRAPDLVVGVSARRPGWERSCPPLAVEYADVGQNEEALQEKIAALLAGGTELVWVVRLVGPLRVEVHARGRAMVVAGLDEELHAPGVLCNPVPVRALVETDAANAVALRNLLQIHGYGSVADIRAEGEAQGEARGEARGLAKAILRVLAARGMVATDAQVAEIRGCQEEATLNGWLVRAVSAGSVEAIFG